MEEARGWEGKIFRQVCEEGQQRAFVLAKTLEQNQIIIVGSKYSDLVSDCKMIPAVTVEDALTMAEKSLENPSEVLIVPHALLTLPVIQPSSSSLD